MGFKVVSAVDLRSGDEAVFAFKPGSSVERRVRVVKAFLIPDGKVEARWVDAESGDTVFEGLYGRDEEVMIVDSLDAAV